MKDFLEIGKIVTVHGIKGEVKVEPWCDSPEFFCEFDELYLSKDKSIIEVQNSRIQKNMVILKIKGIDTIEQAAPFRNKILYINKEDVELDEDTYFIQDLIGLDVIDADSGYSYGELADVSETGANDVYHIKSKDGKMYYIPAIADVVIETNIADCKMLIRPLKGLFDDEN